MARHKLFALLALGSGAIWFGVFLLHPRAAVWEAKGAEHAVSAAQAPGAATQPQSAADQTTPAAAQGQPPAAQNTPAAQPAQNTPQPQLAQTQPAPAEKPAAAPDLDGAKQLLAQGKKFEARAILTRLILAAPDGPGRDTLKQMLDAVNKDLFFSNKTPSPDCISYTVADGDTLGGIAQKQGRDLYFSQVIMLINGIARPESLRPRRTLKIPNAAFSAIVRKSAHRLIILLGGQYIKEYPVALGAPATPTPEGTFVIDAKAINPDWTAPDGTVYKHGDPNNILGTRWLAFKDTPDHQGLGVHGTSEPPSIGKDASDGCVRMLNHDVEEVFGMLSPGDTVEIKNRVPKAQRATEGARQ